jgi:hypothetical protein
MFSAVGVRFFQYYIRISLRGGDVSVTRPLLRRENQVRNIAQAAAKIKNESHFR